MCSTKWNMGFHSIMNIVCLCLADWEEWASWWEAETQGRERELGAAGQTLECYTELCTSSSSDTHSLCCPRASLRAEAHDACHRLPWVPYVAIHATRRRRYLTGCWILSPCCLISIWCQSLWIMPTCCLSREGDSSLICTPNFMWDCCCLTSSISIIGDV